MGENANPIEVAIFNYFWLREYRRRNKNYIEDFNSLVKLVKKKLNKKEVDEENLVIEIEFKAMQHVLKNKKYAEKMKGRKDFGVSDKDIYRSIDKEIKDEINSFAKKYGVDKRKLPS